METYKGQFESLISKLVCRRMVVGISFTSSLSQVQFSHWYFKQYFVFGWRNLPFIFPKPCFLCVWELLAHTAGTWRSICEDKWWDGGIFLQSVPCLAQPPVFAELLAKAKNAAVETASPSFLKLWESHRLEASFRGSSFNGINKHPKEFPLLDMEGRKRLTSWN